MKEFVDFAGKCVVNGKKPKQKYLADKSEHCAVMCSSNVDCYGYSVSSSKQCLHYEESGLTGGDKSEHHCFAKTIQAATYKDAGKGKCLNRDGKNAASKYFARQGKDCEDYCSQNVKCFGYSVSSSNNCMLWTENALKGGGKNWGNAHCHIKQYVYAESTK